MALPFLALQGPVPWMAPEAIGELKYSPESDTWSLGITFWEIVSGLDPAQQMELVDLAVAIRDRGFHPFIPPFIPKYLVDIFEGCWAVTPSSRLSLDSIAKILSSATTVQPVVVTTNKAKSDKRKTKADGGKEKDIGAEVERLKLRLKQLEKEIEAVLLENAELEAKAPATSPARKSGWRTSIKPSAMSNIAVPGRDEVEMSPMSNTHGGYTTVPDDKPQTDPSPKRKKSIRKPKDSGNVYAPVPAGAEGQGSSSLNTLIDMPGADSPMVPSKLTIIAPPPVDPESPYTALPGAPSASGVNATTVGYTALDGDEEHEIVVSPRSGEKRKKKKKKGTKTPRGGRDD
jgi:serine/threonine protein kinase